MLMASARAAESDDSTAAAGRDSGLPEKPAKHAPSTIATGGDSGLPETPAGTTTGPRGQSSTTSGAARRRQRRARQEAQGGGPGQENPPAAAGSQETAAAANSKAGEGVEAGHSQPVTAPAPVEEKAARRGKTHTQAQTPGHNPDAAGPSYASKARQQPAITVLGADGPLSAEQLIQVARVVDTHLWKLALKGEAIEVEHMLRKDACLFLCPRTAESGTRLLAMLPQMDWEGCPKMAFMREDERPRTKRHRLWIPAQSVVTSTEELRRGLIAVNPGLPATGIVVHDTVARRDGSGFLAVLGLSDAWMKRYPDMSKVYIGARKSQIFCYEADDTRPPPPPKKGGAEAKASNLQTAVEEVEDGAPPQKSAKTTATCRPQGRPEADPRPGKAARAAEPRKGGGRDPARSTRKRALIQRAKEASASAKEYFRRRAAGETIAAGEPRAHVARGPNRGRGAGQSQPDRRDSGSADHGAPAMEEAQTTAPGNSKGDGPGVSGETATADSAGAIDPLACQGPSPEAEPMDTSTLEREAVGPEEEAGLLAHSP